MNKDIQARVSKLSGPAQSHFQTLVDEGKSNPAKAMAKLRAAHRPEAD